MQGLEQFLNVFSFTNQLFFSFLRLGLTAFGGPAMIAYIKELSVKKNKWLDEERFKDGVVLCQSIPGATAIQMAGLCGAEGQRVEGGFGLLCRLWAAGFYFHAAIFDFI